MFEGETGYWGTCVYSSAAGLKIWNGIYSV